LGRYLVAIRDDVEQQHMVSTPMRSFRRNYNVDKVALQQLFNEYDTDKTGNITITELETMLVSLLVFFDRNNKDNWLVCF